MTLSSFFLSSPFASFPAFPSSDLIGHLSPIEIFQMGGNLLKCRAANLLLPAACLVLPLFLLLLLAFVFVFWCFAGSFWWDNLRLWLVLIVSCDKTATTNNKRQPIAPTPNSTDYVLKMADRCLVSRGYQIMGKGVAVANGCPPKYFVCLCR